MIRFAPKTAVLFACVMVAVAGCHKNQTPQSTQTPVDQSAAAANPQTVTPTQPVADANPPASTASASTAPQTASSAPASPSTAAPVAPATPVQQAQGAAPAPPPPASASNNAPQPAPIVVPDGTALHMRINQHISVKTSHAGDAFDGTIVEPVVVNGTEVIPAGSLAQGRVVESHRRGHFKGRSILELKLVGVNVNGRQYHLDTSTITRTKKGKGKRTAAFIGGGTGLGMLIGGVASGGAGLLIGGLSGAGAGTLGAAFTGNRDIDIPAETVMTFRLAQPIQLQ